MSDTHRVEFARLVWIQSPKLVRDEPRNPGIAPERMGCFVGIRDEVSFDITNMFTGQWELVCAYNSVNLVLNVLAYISHGDWEVDRQVVANMRNGLRLGLDNFELSIALAYLSQSG